MKSLIKRFSKETIDGLAYEASAANPDRVTRAEAKRLLDILLAQDARASRTHAASRQSASKPAPQSRRAGGMTDAEKKAFAIRNDLIRPVLCVQKFRDRIVFGTSHPRGSPFKVPNV